MKKLLVALLLLKIYSLLQGTYNFICFKLIFITMEQVEGQIIEERDIIDVTPEQPEQPEEECKTCKQKGLTKKINKLYLNSIFKL